MKKLLMILLGVVIMNNLVAQNTLDKAGLDAGSPAAAAYSLRLLSSGYSGPAIQVRRSSDDAVSDIGFSASGNLDTLALLAFAGTGNAFVTTWYDQSGNARHMVKADPNMQPQVLYNGLFKYIGSRVAIDFNVNKGLVFTGSLTVASISTVVRSESVVWPNHHAILDGSPRIGGILYSNGTSFWPGETPLAIWKNGYPKTVLESLSPVNEGMVLSFSSLTPVISQLFAGNFDGGGGGGSVLETEAIAFTSLMPSNIRQELECNEGLYYGITTSCNTVINNQPSAAAYATCMGSTASPLVVNASGVGLTYQWFSNSAASNTGGIAIPGATGNTLVPNTDAVGITYYYVEISSSHVSTVVSNVSGAITVDAPTTVIITPASAIIHAGSSVSLTASGASSFTWGADNATPLDHVNNYRMAVGLRRLRTAYSGSAIRLRRQIDNAEADFGFAGSELDMSAINSFLGGSNGYCSILYDQSGFGNDMAQGNSSEQPLFVAAGFNGKPALHFSTSQSMLNGTDFPAPFSVIYCARQTGGSRGRVLTCTNNNWLLGWWGAQKRKAYFEGWVTPDNGDPSDDSAYVYSATGTGSMSSVYENGVLISSNANGVTGPSRLSFNGNERSDFDMTELFVFNDALANPDREAVENSSGSYCGVFGAPTVFGTSLLVSPTVTTTYIVTGYSANAGCAVQQNAVVTVLNNPGLSNFPAQTRLYYDSLYHISAPSGNSAGAFSYYSSNPAVATIIGTDVLITGTGVTTITAIQDSTGSYYSDSISTSLTVTTASVVSANGAVSSTNYQYINKNGARAGTRGVNENGASLITKSGGDGLTPGTASSSAYQIKQDYPASIDGLYWIANPNINGGIPFRIYADMTTDGGGWTLLLCNKSPNLGWDNNNALLRNESNPDINNIYSIIGWADFIKKSSIGFQYMIDAQTRGANGGIWTANGNYSFTSTSNNNTDITLNTKFGTWNYGGSDIEARMPWYAPGHPGLITTSESADGDWWGTLIANAGWDPAPYLGSSLQNPGIIWYWVR